jgi:iron uptake system EfeUOB component EfeO/EfeM
MEARIARLEAHTDNIQSNVQLLREEMKAFSTRTETRFSELDKKIDAKVGALDEKIDTKFGELDRKIDAKAGALSEKIDTKFGELDRKIDAKTGALDEKIDTKFGELNRKIDALAEKVDSKFEQLRTSIESMKLGRVWDRVWMLLSMGILLGVMARGFKWI